MKAEELMFWDFVNHPDCGNVKISILGKFLSETSDGKLLNTDSFEPIPITSEMLEKNGFESVASDMWFSLIEGYRVTLVSFNQDYVLSIDTTIECTDCAGNIEINLRYVHELQHIFRLFGIEKEITL